MPALREREEGRKGEREEVREERRDGRDRERTEEKEVWKPGETVGCIKCCLPVKFNDCRSLQYGTGDVNKSRFGGLVGMTAQLEWA